MQAFSGIDLQISNQDANPFGNLSTAGFAAPLPSNLNGSPTSDSFGASAQNGASAPQGGGILSGLFATLMNDINALAGSVNPQSNGAPNAAAAQNAPTATPIPADDEQPAAQSLVYHPDEGGSTTLIGLYGQPADDWP